MKNRLKTTAYLAGSMESAPELGNGWRKDITPFLEGLGMEVLNPCEFEPHQLANLRPNRLPEFYTGKHGQRIKPNHWHELKSATEPHLYARFLKYMRKIIAYDIKVVSNLSDYIIVLWDENASKGAGTHSELTAAYLNNVPVYAVITSSMPAWAIACCTETFSDFEELKEFLQEEFLNE